MYHNYNELYAYYTGGQDLYHFGIKGMKWGVRRYQNEDGSYTDAGKARRNSSSSSSSSSKSSSSAKNQSSNKNQKSEEEVAAEKANTLSSNVNASTRAASDIVKKSSSMKNSSSSTTDLSDMTDEELRSAISRAQLEEQYNRYYNTDTSSDGAEKVSNVLSIIGDVATIGASAVSTYAVIKSLLT